MHVVAENRRFTLLQHGEGRLSRLCSALGFGARDERRMIAILARMGSSWGAATPAKPPRWPSDICDDCSPFEFSVAFDGAGQVPEAGGRSGVELRILAEVQAQSPNVFSNWRAARAFTEELESAAGVSLARFRAIEDLFAPTLATRRFSLWHAVCFRPGELPDYKLYLNPAAAGPGSARATVEQALSRLGFTGAERYLPRTTATDRTIYFSLDLPLFCAPRRPATSGRGSAPPAGARSVSPSGAPAGARVKVYTAHRDATPEHVEEALRAAGGYVPGQVSRFCEAMGGCRGPFVRRPIQTCLSFTAGSAVPTSGTVYFPVRSYADSDLEVRGRVLAYLPPETAGLYERALSAHATRPLEEGVGMQTYVSLRQGAGPRRVTVYLSPEIYAVDRSGSTEISGIMTRPTRRRSVF